MKTRMDGLFCVVGGFDNRLDNRRQTVIVEFLFDQTSWYHACKYHATSPGIINFTVAALPPLVLLGPCDSPPSALQCASGNVSCLEILGAKNCTHPGHLNFQVLEVKMAGASAIFSPPRFPDSSRYQMHFLPILVHVILVFTPCSFLFLYFSLSLFRSPDLEN